LPRTKYGGDGRAVGKRPILNQRTLVSIITKKGGKKKSARCSGGRKSKAVNRGRRAFREKRKRALVGKISPILFSGTQKDPYRMGAKTFR